MIITSKELAALKAIDFSDYSETLGDPVWSWDVADNLGTDSTSKGGVLASLVKKGLIHVDTNQGEDNCICMLDAGIKIYVETVGLDALSSFYEQKGEIK